ncbi:hypothetical protein [Chromobacterium vaccinii]|uniref:hypothetical protein n=1 Tax=Chromobacterium vaccinii TaxID=1108595 RepID=UPI0011AB7A13|nr:hypothetical protein [Chromobacterium vaccinii]
MESFDLNKQNIKTNKKNESLQKAKAESEGRELTSGEIALVKKLFGNAIDYSFVRIHKGKLIPGIQGNEVSMTPWGELYMPVDNYLDDFSTVSPVKYNFLHHFIHEMSHVWQYQRKARFTRGSLAVCGGGLALATGMANALDNVSDIMPKKMSEEVKDLAGSIDPYTYRDKYHKDLFQYNMESQAEILADYFMSEIMKIPGYVGKSSNRRVRGPFFYDEVLANFFIEIEKSENRPRNLKTQWGIK